MILSHGSLWVAWCYRLFHFLLKTLFGDSFGYTELRGWYSLDNIDATLRFSEQTKQTTLRFQPCVTGHEKAFTISRPYSCTCGIVRSYIDVCIYTRNAKIGFRKISNTTGLDSYDCICHFIFPHRSSFSPCADWIFHRFMELCADSAQQLSLGLFNGLHF